MSLVGFGGGESHQFSVPSLFTPNLADPAELCDATSRNTQIGQRSRADAGSIGPSALDRKNRDVQSTVRSHQLRHCRRQRACPAPAVAERRTTHVRTSVLAALPQPRHAASAAADLVAAHSALDSPILSIETARTYAPAISMGAVAVFVRFSAHAVDRPPRAAQRRGHTRRPA